MGAEALRWVEIDPCYVYHVANAFEEADGSRIVAISVWASPEAMAAGAQELFASVADLPLDQWETRPYESATLTQVA